MKDSAEGAVVTKLAAPVNGKDPIRIAFLGGPRTGKTASISKLSCGTYRDTYYPSRKTIPVLFTYTASSPESQLILDGSNSKRFLNNASVREDLLLSPVIYDSLARSTMTVQAPGSASFEIAQPATCTKNDIYAITRDTPTSATEITPILAELVDTPAFNKNQFIPFLEASIHARLGKDVLKKLADTPRQPVNTEPLLVASGAGEMNGAIDGYFLLYSAVPSFEPPGYEEAPSVPNTQTESPRSSGESYGTPDRYAFQDTSLDTSLSLLPVIKAGLEEAWREYHTYKTRWNAGKEKDMFSIKSAFRHMFDGNPASRSSAPDAKLLDTSLNPADPSCPPPIWIICTHSNSHLASPNLINDGKKLAQQWRCGYLAIDVDQDIDQMMALMIREVAERRSLQRGRRRR